MWLFDHNRLCELHNRSNAPCSPILINHG